MRKTSSALPRPPGEWCPDPTRGPRPPRRGLMYIDGPTNTQLSLLIEINLIWHGARFGRPLQRSGRRMLRDPAGRSAAAHRGERKKQTRTRKVEAPPSSGAPCLRRGGAFFPFFGHAKQSITATERSHQCPRPCAPQRCAQPAPAGPPLSRDPRPLAPSAHWYSTFP